MTDLGGFFEAFMPMLALRASAAEVEQRIGASPSGTQRLAFYGELAKRNRFLALRNVCPALRQAALMQERPIWHELVMRFVSRQMPVHRDPNELARGLSDFLASERASGWSIPTYLEEIADFEFSEWAVGVHPFESSVDDPGLERTLLARSYSHDIPAFVNAFRTRGADALPAPVPTNVLIYRHVSTNLPCTFFPTALGLAVVARRAGKALALPGVTAALLEEAERELERHGVLRART